MGKIKVAEAEQEVDRMLGSMTAEQVIDVRTLIEQRKLNNGEMYLEEDAMGSFECGCFYGLCVVARDGFKSRDNGIQTMQASDIAFANHGKDYGIPGGGIEDLLIKHRRTARKLILDRIEHRIIKEIREKECQEKEALATVS